MTARECWAATRNNLSFKLSGRAARCLCATAVLYTFSPAAALAAAEDSATAPRREREASRNVALGKVDWITGSSHQGRKFQQTMLDSGSRFLTGELEARSLDQLRRQPAEVAPAE